MALERDPESRYRTFATSAGTLDACRDCGAVVADRVAHDRHHDVQARHPWFPTRETR